MILKVHTSDFDFEGDLLKTFSSCGDTDYFLRRHSRSIITVYKDTRFSRRNHIDIVVKPLVI